MSGAIPTLKRVAELAVENHGTSTRFRDKPILRLTIESDDGRYCACSWDFAKLVKSLADDPTCDVTVEYTKWVNWTVNQNPPQRSSQPAAAAQVAGVDQKSFGRVIEAFRTYVDRNFAQVVKALGANRQRVDELEKKLEHK